MAQKLFGLKIGGSVITDKTKPYTAKVDSIRSIAKVLKNIDKPMIIAHGSGSFGHTSAQKYGGKNGYVSKWGIAKVARDAQEINRIVVDIFVEEGLPVISFSPRSFFIAEKGKVKDFFLAPIEEALKQGLIPVIYGDGIWDIAQKTTIFSGETSLNFICRQLQTRNFETKKIIQLCNVDGVLDKEKNVIPEITKQNWGDIKNNITSLEVADVTGGMMHKVEDALELAKHNIETTIINGNAVVSVKDALEGKNVKGTVIR